MAMAGIVIIGVLAFTIAIEVTCLSFLVSFSRRDGKKNE